MSARPALFEARSDLIAALALAKPPIVHGEVDEGDIHDLCDHMLDAARAFDEYVLAIGHALKALGGSCSIDLTKFTNQTTGALEGRTTLEFEKVIECLRDYATVSAHANRRA